VNLIEKIVLEMHSSWTQGSALEVGIDGYIELFNPASGEATGTRIAVQSKVVNKFANDSGDTFDYWCDRRDIEYWLQGNTPVILVVSRPDTGEAYWVSIKDHFAGKGSDASSRITFDKRSSALTPSSIHDLVRLGKDPGAGLYLAPVPSEELLYSNLLRLDHFPTRLWIADTPFRTGSEVAAALREANAGFQGAWLLREKRIFAFQDLRERPWDSICDRGTCEPFDTAEWSGSDDADRQRQFVHLLNHALRVQLRPRIKFWPDLECYAMAGNLSDAGKSIAYRSAKRDSFLTAVTKHTKTLEDGRTYTSLRHIGFRGQFRRIEGQWYLEITPTYVFTNDGTEISRFHQDRLKGIKRLEGNRAVLSALLFWADQLRPRLGLFSTDRSILTFGPLAQLSCNVGIDDESWRKRDPAPPPDLEDGPGVQIRLDFGSGIRA
jgi:hypothetical protein